MSKKVKVTKADVEQLKKLGLIEERERNMWCGYRPHVDESKKWKAQNRPKHKKLVFEY